MSQTNYIETLIIRYLQQDISEEDLRELDAWLGESDNNMSHFFQLKDIYDLMHNSKQFKEEELEKSWQRMCIKLADKPIITTADSKRKVIIIHSLKYIAIITVAVLLGWVIGDISNRSDLDSEDNILTFNEIHVEKGGKPNTLILSDGSKVSLNTSTIFKYPSNFSKKNREVYLNGEAYFDIKRDSLKPFVVNLKNQQITVLGTSFNIEAYDDEAYSIVTLINGSISLETFSENGESMSNLLMKPNQRAFYDKETGIISVEDVEVSLSQAWMKGIYKFKDEPLLLIMKRLENYYGITIHLKDDNLNNIKYTGTFSLNQNIQEVLKINFCAESIFRQSVAN